MISLRPAKPTEAQYLSDLAGRSKAHWPYDKDYLEKARAVTHLAPEDIASWPFTVATEQEKIVGFAGVCEVKGENMLDHLWIEPSHIGKGIGQILFEDSIQNAKKLGWNSFTIAADPYAEAFYTKMGAVRIGERESKIKKGFFLPLLEYKIP